MFLLYVRETGEEYGDGALEAVVALARMFVQYAKDTEEAHGGDFLKFLRRQAMAVEAGED
jgi:hypothetical protein